MVVESAQSSDLGTSALFERILTSARSARREESILMLFWKLTTQIKLLQQSKLFLMKISIQRLKLTETSTILLKNFLEMDQDIMAITMVIVMESMESVLLKELRKSTHLSTLSAVKEFVPMELNLQVQLRWTQLNLNPQDLVNKTSMLLTKLPLKEIWQTLWKPPSKLSRTTQIFKISSMGLKSTWRLFSRIVEELMALNVQ